MISCRIFVFTLINHNSAVTAAIENFCSLILFYYIYREIEIIKQHARKKPLVFTDMNMYIYINFNSKISFQYLVHMSFF